MRSKALGRQSAVVVLPLEYANGESKSKECR